MEKEAKALIDNLFKNFNTFMRHMFSGLVAVFLFEIGNSGVDVYADIRVVKELEPSQGVCYALVAFVVGNLIYLFSRYVICALIMWRLHKKYPDKYARGLATGTSASYIVEIGNFAQYRWSKDFSPKLEEYLINAWGWIHGLGSVAFVFFVIPLYFIILKDSIFRWWFGGICMLAGVSLAVAYWYHICQLLSMENIAYREKDIARCTSITGLEVYRKRCDGNNDLDNAKVLCTQCREATQACGIAGGFLEETIQAARDQAGNRCECTRVGCCH